MIPEPYKIRIIPFYCYEIPSNRRLERDYDFLCSINPKAAMVPFPKWRRYTIEAYQRAIMRTRLLEAQNHRCAYCAASIGEERIIKDGKRIQAPATVDHFIPTSKGGKNFYSNMVAACDNCNRKKMDKIFCYNTPEGLMEIEIFIAKRTGTFYLQRNLAEIDV